MKKITRVKNTIIKSAADFFTPIILIFGFYEIFHGHLGIGGGFVGGILVAAVIILIYIGYDQENSSKLFNMELLRKNQGIGAIIQTSLALIGLVFFTGFCRNIFFDMGEAGNLFSSGNIFFMNLSVGYGTLAGIGFLILIFIGIYSSEKKDNE